MIRGTSATFKFQLPYPTEQILSGKVIFWQEETQLVIVKEWEDLDVKSGTNDILVSLLPEETIGFSSEYKAMAQFKGDLKPDGAKIVASKPYLISVHPLYPGLDVDDFDIFSYGDRVVMLDAGELVVNSNG